MFIFKNLGLHMCFAPGLVQDGKMKACRSRMKFSIKFFCKMSYGYYYFCSGLSTYMNMIFTAKICLTQVLLDYGLSGASRLVLANTRLAKALDQVD